MTDEQRFWANVKKGPGCWLWQGYGSKYGQTTWGGKTALVHRVAWMLANGRPVPVGHQIDHLCKTRWCVRPRHLEAVLPAENNRRSDSPTALNGRKVECSKGHPFTPENTYTPPSGGRYCRTCRRDNDARRWPLRKADLRAALDDNGGSDER